MLANLRLFDGTGAPVRDDMTITIEGGRIAAISPSRPENSASARVIDLGGRFLMPGIIDCHAHLMASAQPERTEGMEPLLPGVGGHLVATSLQKTLRMGITTIRDVGAYDHTLFEVRQAMRFGAFRGSRLLISGRIVSATSAGGRHFSGMYREADGPDEMRKAAREQLRAGADFVKIMTTGARSVELENPDPAQVTREEIAALVDEVHRLGFRVAAHCEGLEGTQLAIEEGVDTIEHGFHLHHLPELLNEFADRGGVLVPTLSFLLDIAERNSVKWSPHLVERGIYNMDEAYKTLAAAINAGAPVAMGYDSAPADQASSELALLVDAGMPAHQALVSATAIGAQALGLEHLIGTVEVGKLADLVVIDGDPLEDVAVLVDRDRIHMVFQIGRPVAGTALEPELV